MSIVTTSNLSPPVQLSFDYKLLSTPVPYLIHLLAADFKTMPANGGSILRMRRYNPLPTATVPFGNSGVVPAPTNLSAVNLDAPMQLYGQFIMINEQVKVACYKSALIELELLAA